MFTDDGPSSQVDSGFAEVGHDDVTEPPQENVFEQNEEVWCVCVCELVACVSSCFS